MCPGCFVCHMDSSTDTTGHDDGWWFWSTLSSISTDCYFRLNVGQIYPVLICLLDVKYMAYHFHRELLARYDAVIWNESCS